jgi:hypothetical protein
MGLRSRRGERWPFPSWLRFSMGSARAHASSGSAFGSVCRRRGRPGRRSLRASEARLARPVRTELRLCEPWAAASGFPAGLRLRRGAGGIARTGWGSRATDRRASGPVVGDLRVHGERVDVRYALIFGFGAQRAGRLVRRNLGSGGSSGRSVRRRFGVDEFRRPFGAKGLRSRRVGRAEDPKEPSGSGGRAQRGSEELRLPRVERPFGSMGLRSRRVEPPSGSTELRLPRVGDRSARRCFGAGGMDSGGFGPSGFRPRRNDGSCPGPRRLRSSRARSGAGRRDGDERGPTPRGDRRRRRRTATRWEKSSEGRNPMSGSGMKQGRQARGGFKKRREVEKT